MDSSIAVRKPVKAKASAEPATKREKSIQVLYWALRGLVLFAFVTVFIPEFNPGRVSTEMNKNFSLFITAVSRSRLTGGTGGLTDEYKQRLFHPATVSLLMFSCVTVLVGVLAVFASAGMSFGSKKLQRLGSWISLGGPVLMLLGTGGNYLAYTQILNPIDTHPVFTIEDYLERVPPHFSWGIIFFLVLGIVMLLLALAARLLLIRTKDEKAADIQEKNRRKDNAAGVSALQGSGAAAAYMAVSGAKIKSPATENAGLTAYRKVKSASGFKIEHKYALFLYTIPILLLTLFFSYLPLLGWRAAFFNYSNEGLGEFVGFYWFRQLFSGSQMKDFLLSLRDTFVMSGLGILTSLLPVIFAVFFAEIKNKHLKRFIQTATTLPNFISWILIYAVAQTLFSTEGLLNNVIEAVTGESQRGWLDRDVKGLYWIQMLSWGVWKGVGWSAIMYLAAISGIDQELYEAASIDGAKRFKKMRYITIPSLIPTFSVMLLLSFAGMLSNGLDQYLVFANNVNKDYLKVLDFYIYDKGLGGEDSTANMMSLATVLSIGKSVVSIMLLFIANQSSKWIRGESII